MPSVTQVIAPNSTASSGSMRFATGVKSVRSTAKTAQAVMPLFKEMRVPRSASCASTGSRIMAARYAIAITRPISPVEKP